MPDAPKAPKPNRRGFATRTIHAGQSPDPSTGAIMTPIYATSTYVQESPGVHKGYEYSRSQNPTRMAYERCLADLESGRQGFAFASGLAAASTVLELLDHGAHVVAMDDLYGGTYRLFERVRKRSAGLSVSYADLSERAALDAALRPETRMIWVETPTNPLLKLVDLERVAETARKRGIIDRLRQHLRQPLGAAPARARLRHRPPFGDQISERPFRHGGRCGRRRREPRARRAPRLPAERRRRGGRAVRQLPGPARPQDAGACAWSAIAPTRSPSPRWLARHAKIERVIYPGLASHPQHALAQHQMHGFGGMVTAFIRGGLEPSRRFLERCEIFALAESLGGVESLIEHPAIMTHASIPAEQRAAHRHRRRAGAPLGRRRGRERSDRGPGPGIALGCGGDPCGAVAEDRPL